MKKLPARRGCPKTVKSSQIPLTASLEADSLSWESTLGSLGVGSLGVFPGGGSSHVSSATGGHAFIQGIKNEYLSHLNTKYFSDSAWLYFLTF